MAMPAGCIRWRVMKKGRKREGLGRVAYWSWCSGQKEYVDKRLLQQRKLGSGDVATKACQRSRLDGKATSRTPGGGYLEASSFPLNHNARMAHILQM